MCAPLKRNAGFRRFWARRGRRLAAPLPSRAGLYGVRTRTPSNKYTHAHFHSDFGSSHWGCLATAPFGGDPSGQHGGACRARGIVARMEVWVVGKVVVVVMAGGEALGVRAKVLGPPVASAARGAVQGIVA
eukprot:11185108-Lingulodinium_polyedra.AAC.1